MHWPLQSQFLWSKIVIMTAQTLTALLVAVLTVHLSKVVMHASQCLCRPDKVVPAVQDFVEAQLGRKFVEPPVFDLKACHADSTPITPLIFVLSAGSDPTAALLQFAAEKDMSSRSVFCLPGFHNSHQHVFLVCSSLYLSVLRMAYMPPRGTMVDENAKAWQLSAAMCSLHQSFVSGTP